MKTLLNSIILCCLLSPVLANEPIYIDSIVAIVEDDVVTNSQLHKEIEIIRKELSAKGRGLPPETSLNSQVLELMITKSILIQEARSRGIKVTDTQLNSTLSDIAKKNNLTLAQFREALLGNGIDYNTFREEVKNNLAINQIKASYARQNVDITEQEVDDFLARNNSDSSSLEYRLSHILIALKDGASSEQVSKAQQQIRDLKKRIDSGEDFFQLATTYSAGSNALQGGDLGWRKLAEIPSLFATNVPQMKVAEVSEPIRSASGFHIIMLSETRDSEQVLVKQTRARHILIKEDELTSREQARQQLEQIREKIINGEDFYELAKQHSDDPGSGGLGGDLGWFEKGVMVPAFQQVLDKTDFGETSEVFRSSFGWHILQVLGRRTVDETEESKRAKIRQQLQEQKQAEVLELWQRRLRDQAFVKIFDS